MALQIPLIPTQLVHALFYACVVPGMVSNRLRTLLQCYIISNHRGITCSGAILSKSTAVLQDAAYRNPPAQSQNRSNQLSSHESSRSETFKC